MRAALFGGPHSIEVADRPDPVVAGPTDAVVRVALACVCGSDLWYYRGEQSPHAPGPIGHEFVGLVEHIGAGVHGIAEGDLVIAPFTYSDGTCAHCRAGVTSQCLAGGSFGNHGIDGGQGEAVCVPLAGSTLVRVPGSGHSDETMRSLLALSDVMCTGHHAAVSAGVGPGSVVAVVGDGAVGLCAVIAARRLGAARIIALSRKPARQALARSFGATDLLAERGEEATEAVLDLTDGVGVDAALECVGTGQSVGTALAIARPGPSLALSEPRTTSTCRSWISWFWTSDELGKIEAADELQIASVRRDGTLRNPVTIWVVRLGDDVFVRSVYGRTSSWFRGAQGRHQAHIRAGGVEKDVLLVETDDQRRDRRRLPHEVPPVRRQHRRHRRHPGSARGHAQARAALLKGETDAATQVWEQHARSLGHSGSAAWG